MERDSDLIKVSDQDKEYASDLLNDLIDEGVAFKSFEDCHQIVRHWLCKHRYESVMADRKQRL